jgi:hypothetical protein
MAKQFIHTIWLKWIQLWTLRNEEIHGRDRLTRELADRYETTRALREVQSIGTTGAYIVDEG